MLEKKAVPPPANALNYRKQLEYLYARKSALDALIESLQRYGQFRARSITAQGKRKPA
jgi:hypothetical protein